MRKASELVEKCSFIGGEPVSDFETRFRNRFQLQSFLGVANGTDAMTLALRALGVKAGDKVLVSTFSFVATLETICNLGAEPVFVDINPDTLQTGLKEIQDAWIPGIRAAQLAWIYGWAPADLTQIRKFFKDADVPLIEDWAQGVGTQIRGQEVVSGADWATVSFYPAKVLGACGDAGGVACENSAFIEKIRQLANHGRDSHYTYAEWGYNSRLDAFQAAALTCKLEFFDSVIEARRKTCEWYRKNLNSRYIKIPEPMDGIKENGYLFPVLTDEREAFKKHLTDQGIGSMIVYPLPLHLQTAAKKNLKRLPSLPGSESISTKVICLPLFFGIGKEELERVMEVVQSFRP